MRWLNLLRRLLFLWPVLASLATGAAAYGAGAAHLADLDRRMTAREAVTPTHADIAAELARTNAELGALNRELRDLRDDVRDLRSDVLDNERGKRR